ncbi:hypothetical protein SDJN03_15731, partial [Cucurbita argyrosperma subsp. sororia]
MEREIGVAITRFPERDESINNDRGHLRNNNKSPQFLLHSTSFIQIHTTTGTPKDLRICSHKSSDFLFHEFLDPLNPFLPSAFFLLRSHTSIKIRAE